MKIVIASLGGSVGKTSITVHMLHPRFPKARVIAVDTANDTVKHFGVEADEYSGDQFSKLYKDIVRRDDVIIDVGGSKEGKQFLEGMDWMDGQDEIDAFIIPSMKDDKDQKAAYKTIELLLAQGVSKEKIKVIFNAVEKDTVEEFDYLLGALTATGIEFSLDAAIFKHEIFDILSAKKRSLPSVLTDTTDYKAKLKACSDDEASEIGDLLTAQKSARKVNANLDTVFNALFASKKAKAAVSAKA